MALDFGDETWKKWDSAGRSDFIGAVKSVLSEESDDRLEKAGKAIWELVMRGLDGTLRRESISSTIGEILASNPAAAGVITDVLNVVDIETACEGDSAKRDKFYAITRDAEQHLNEKLMKERLEIETLQEVGTVKNKSFYTRFIKVKTKLYYKQRKFNLLREESEGYAKLITELGQEISDEVTPEIILEVIKSLIGCFNLDPNRVLDIILESFECRPQHDEFFIPLICSYMGDRKILSEVLGYKFTLYHSGLGETEKSDSEPVYTPTSLYTVTALMLKHDVVSLDDIYGWLLPEDKQITSAWEKEMADAKEYVRKLNIISTKDKEETPEEPEPPCRKVNVNQKFGLCEALCRVGAWSHVQKLFDRIPETCLMSQPSVALALCELLNILVDPVYRKNLGSLSGVVKQSLKISKSIQKSPAPAQTFADMKEVIIPMLLSLGPSLHLDPVLLCKIIRLSKASLSNSGGKKENVQNKIMYFDVITLLDEVLLPSLSYMEANCSIAEEIWSLLKLLPYQQRYCLYVRWKNESHSKHPTLMIKRGDALKKIKNIMKRVSKENVKPVGRSIGKLTHSSPGFLFDYVVTQIQVYDNLIIPVVDSLKYLTSLSYDVLGCCLVEALSQADKKRFKHDGTSISLWLQSLASFCGAVFKKYPIDLAGLLQYVANQLLAQKSLDLLIVKEIVHKMAGVEAAEELTSDQLEAMCGGELLRGEAGNYGQAKNTKKSSTRLKESLTEQNLAVALCLLMAQQRYCVVYKETEQSHLKLVGKLFDQCQDTLVQYGTFLAASLTIEEYNSRLPPISNLLSKYYIHSDVAFFLARPMFNHAINNKVDNLRRAHPNSKSLTVAEKHELYIEACEIVLNPVVESVRPLHPPKVWEDISPNFIVTFWSLTSYDLYVPVDAYQREVDKMKQIAQQQADSKEGSSGKNKREQDKTLALVERLQDEWKKHNEHVDKIMARLKKEKDTWFLSRSAKSAKNETITQFLQLCVFPRCTFTAPDALYCAKFVEVIHSLKTTNFTTLLCYDRIFCDITYMVTSCTENEANRLGRFLCAMLETVTRWHKNRETYDDECANFPGFVTKFKVSNQFSDANDHVGYENYRHVCHKWHYKITKALVVCLDSKDYVQIRNSLIILIKILPFFPVLVKLYHIIDARIEKVRNEEKDKRQDLYILATSYSGQLKARSSKMIHEKDFHLVSEKRAGEGVATKVEVNTGEGSKKPEANGTTSDTKKVIITVSSHSGSKSSRKVETTTSQRKDDGERRTKERRDQRESPSTNKWDREKYDEGSSRYRDNADGEMSSLSNSSPSASRLSQEPDPDAKRRKTESSAKRSEADDKADKKEKSKAKSSRDEDKDARKERKTNRKRERTDEGATTSETTKRRKDDERSSKAQNGDQDRPRFSRERSPYSRERSYDERDKQYPFHC
ncbi:THO complex subunit 2 isoform X2 [Neocloeon triangulifer]|uniref:THO complex subunit 2 isoform X2 n=1 Tax=Neocloeon triangulifer TaxID=2078957 RepID=UPI00286EC978|nr:THO complex subunit 2 isoform X2 [Neocloeon triangulifer]